MNRKYRKTLIAGNWKMNKTRAEAVELVKAIAPKASGASCGVIVCVPFTDLDAVCAAANALPVFAS